MATERGRVKRSRWFRRNPPASSVEHCQLDRRFSGIGKGSRCLEDDGLSGRQWAMGPVFFGRG